MTMDIQIAEYKKRPQIIQIYMTVILSRVVLLLHLYINLHCKQFLHGAVSKILKGHQLKVLVLNGQKNYTSLRSCIIAIEVLCPKI